MDWSFRIGDIVVIAAFLGTIILQAVYIGKFIMRLEIMEARFSSFEESQKLIVGALTTIAVQSSRLDRLERDVNEIRHGEGLVGVSMLGKSK